MNIDILNANCGLGYSRGHACLRVGLKYLSRVVVRSRDGSSRTDVGGRPAGAGRRSERASERDCRSSRRRRRPSPFRKTAPHRRRATSSEIETVRQRATPHVSYDRRNDGTVARMMRLRIGPAPSFRSVWRRRMANETRKAAAAASAAAAGCVVVVVVVVWFYRFRPEIRRDYPLNLSILISGGKETNQDSLSNGE